MTMTTFGYLRFPIGCCYYGQDLIPVPRASLWAAMHTVPAFHVVGSLALAICTISTNDGADFWVLAVQSRTITPTG
jgi:hypothetical protein